MTIISKDIYELPENKRVIRISNSVNVKNEEKSNPNPRCKITIILPTYNERENIHILIPQLEKLIEKNNFNGYLIIIDDNSKDGTAEISLEFARAYKNIIVIQRPTKLGLGSAYVIGFKYAIEKLGSEFIIMMDSDLSHRPGYIPTFLKCIKHEDAGLIIGSRYCKDGGTEQWPFLRKLISYSANFLSRFLLGLYPRDVTSGFRCFKAETLKKINYNTLHSNGYSFMEELVFRTKEKKIKIRETPIIFYERRYGYSKLGKA
ncbi:MAG: polyprenol monophosphomannose synthase, partial [Promethearchaeota archaeon]